MFRKTAAIAALTLGLAACSSSPAENTPAPEASPSADTSASATTDSPSGELTVFAAASLNAAFPEIAEKVFAKDYPNVGVSFAFEGSSSLAEKILAGAPVDVFASADERNMEKVGDLAVSPFAFTKNTLRLIVPAGNPAGVTDLASASENKLVVCAPQVPCGGVTEKVAEHLGVAISPVSEEQSVTDVRTKVETGEADAGLVYFTDAKLSGDKVEIIDVPGIGDIDTPYMLATLTDAPSPELAQAFVDAIMSPEGQEILATYGFGDGK